MNLKKINLKSIRIDGGTQSRVSINEDAVASYAEAMAEGATLPPVVVFRDGADDWLADGFHRYHAHNRTGAASIEADVRAGTLIEAQLFATSANQGHGLQRSNDDKRKAVLRTLELMPDWSDRQIARHVGVSNKTVAAHRPAIWGISSDSEPESITVTRGGTTYQQKAKGKPAKDAPAKKKAATKAEQIAEYKRIAIEAEAAMNDALAENTSMGAAFDADDRTAALFEENTQLRAQVKQLRLSLAGQTNKNNELISMIKSLQAKLKKLEATA